MNIVVDELIVNYERKGSGKSVVLLHGWGDTADSFRDLCQHLSKKYEVISLDLPGFGKTDPPKTTWGLTDYANFVAHFIEKLQIGDVFGLVGHSNGAAIAVRAVSSKIIKPNRLVLLASSGIRSEYKKRRRVLRLAAKTGKLLVLPLPKRIQLKLRKKAYKTIGSDLFVAEHLQDTFKSVVTDDISREARKVHLPTLLVYGEDDEATPPRYGEMLHDAIKPSQLVIIGQAGHFIHHDQPAKVQTHIERFLGEKST